MRCKHVAGAAIFVAAALIGSSALAADSSTEREARDRAQIEKLM